MAEEKFYTINEAAQLAGISEDELRCAVQDGLLAGRLLQNVGTYQVRHQDLMSYLKRRGKNDSLQKSVRRKILIIDDEINFANIMKIELERDPRIEAKFATWGRDGVRLAKE